MSSERKIALAAFISLKLAIENLVNNRLSSISLAPPTQQILQFAYEQVKSSEEIARRLLFGSTSRLDLDIKIATLKLLATIRSLTRKHKLLFKEFSTEEVEDLKQDILSFAELFKKMHSDGEQELRDEDDQNGVVSSKMVGFSEDYLELKRRLMRPSCFPGSIRPGVVVLVGMAGIGKTTLAGKVFEDPDIVEKYELRLWVRIGRKCPLKEIPRRILAAVNPDLVKGDDQEIARNLLECLKVKKYLIVLDDVWNKYTACHFFFRSEYKACEVDPFPYNGNESRVLLTTRTWQADQYDGHFPEYVLKMRLLNKEESWDLLREKVFVEGICPPHLEKVGKKIAENCKGLPLMIVKVAEILSEVEKMPKYWDEVAAKKNHHIFVDAYDQIAEVLYSSYEVLTDKLKLCFLYMVVFPQDYEIPRSKLIYMWNTDGFLETNANKFQQVGAMECLNELVSNNLVMIYRTNLSRFSNDDEIKTCGLHSSFWHLSRREAREAKFCYILTNPDDGFGQGIEGQSRLSFHNNVFLGFKDLREYVEDKCTSTTRSLLCYGPYQQFQVPLCFGLKLLRELDALAIRFYEFPLEVLQLVELRYLALTLNGTLPTSISQLSNLQTLIVGRHLSIRSRGEHPSLPVEIWDMKELKHVEVMGSDVVDPCGATLERIVTLSNVGAHSCKEGILKAIPKVEKLGIRIELAYYDDYDKFLSCLDHLSDLKELRSLKCVLLSSSIVRPLAPIPVFPKTLIKLSLSGLGYPWEEMSKITSLLFLGVLKLRNYAFQGPKWEVMEKFGIHTLVIEGSDLVEWRIGSESLKSLTSLSLKHCYHLKKIQWEYGISGNRMHWACYNSLRKIELVDCNPLGLEQMEKALPKWKKDALQVHSSWDY